MPGVGMHSPGNKGGEALNLLFNLRLNLRLNLQFVRLCGEKFPLYRKLLSTAMSIG
jgi:hypothetical protein